MTGPAPPRSIEGSIEGSTDGAIGPGVRAAVAWAVDLVGDGARVGLGTGRAAAAFIDSLGGRVRQGLTVGVVPTSRASAQQARALGIPFVDLDDDVPLDITVDGADEVAPNLDLLKGKGGALVKERIVAAASREQVIVVGSDKLVSVLGTRGPVPVEVIPLGRGHVARGLQALGLRSTLRLDGGVGGRPFVTENHNLILDVTLAAGLADGRAARALERAIRALAGVVDTGLFLGTAGRVAVGHDDGRLTILSAPPPDAESGNAR
ncbi:MAG: ribose-5-phosphate isomerase RpiA [Pseudomonadota bacterium]